MEWNEPSVTNRGQQQSGQNIPVLMPDNLSKGVQTASEAFRAFPFAHRLIATEIHLIFFINIQALFP